MKNAPLRLEKIVACRWTWKLQVFCHLRPPQQIRKVTSITSIHLSLRRLPKQCHLPATLLLQLLQRLLIQACLTLRLPVLELLCPSPFLRPMLPWLTHTPRLQLSTMFRLHMSLRLLTIITTQELLPFHTLWCLQRHHLLGLCRSSVPVLVPQHCKWNCSTKTEGLGFTFQKLARSVLRDSMQSERCVSGGNASSTIAAKSWLTVVLASRVDL